jgi:hypothetical protein
MIQSGIGRYGYNNKGDGAGIWLDPNKFHRVITGNINFKTLAELIKVRSRVAADELIQQYLDRGLINEAEYFNAIELLPSR